jgi:uncharacterized protein YdeI (YjbR/CyaY-like superfamily)
MPPDPLPTVDVMDRPQWRGWLEQHHTSEAGIWLVLYKHRTPARSLTLEEAIQEGLCFGWIDSITKRLDENRYLRKFTPRRPDSRWSTLNRRRYADLLARGLVAPPGLERPPTGKSGDAPRPASIPDYVEKGLKANPPAWGFFEHLPPSHRRQYIAWIDSAKREETKEKRLREAIARLIAGQRLGLK